MSQPIQNVHNLTSALSTNHKALSGYSHIGQLPRVHIMENTTQFSSANDTSPIQYAPHFGNRFHNLARAIFQPVTESYLIGFTVQDVIGLWFPRIINSLERGRIPYNPNEDPGTAKRSGLEQRGHALKESIKGLNWWNGFEETAREVQSGPGYLFVQSLFVALTTGWWMGRRGLMMSVQNLDTFTSHLHHVLKDSSLAKTINMPFVAAKRKMTQQLLSQMTEQVFHHPDALIVVSPMLNKAERDMLRHAEQPFQLWLAKHFKASGTLVKFSDAFNLWQQQYLKTMCNPSQKAHKSSQLAPLEKVFEELVVQWNSSVKGITDPTKMTLFELPKIAPVISGKTLHGSMDAHQFLINFEKYITTFPEIINHLKASGTTGGTTGAISQLSENTLPTVLRTLRNTTVVNKFWVCVIATLLGGLNHFYVSAVAQSMKRKYPANRLIPLPQTTVRHVSTPANYIETGGLAHA